jgi:CheY-like chemotaxis protein
MDRSQQNNAGKKSSPRANAILIVDDDADSREGMADLLAPYGYTILQAENGRLALDLIERYTHRHFRVILLDLEMPIMDGWTFLDHLNRQAGRPRPKIIVITGQAPTRPLAGVLAVMRKPVNADELLASVHQI